MRRDLTCQEIVELVTAYLEGALSARDRRRFEAHLAGCAALHGYVEQMRVTLERVGTVTPDGLSPGGGAGAARRVRRLAGLRMRERRGRFDVVVLGAGPGGRGRGRAAWARAACRWRSSSRSYRR